MSSELRADRDNLDDSEWTASADATVVRAHHHSAGARHRPPKDISADVLAPTVFDGAIRPTTGTGGNIECPGSRRLGATGVREREVVVKP